MKTIVIETAGRHYEHVMDPKVFVGLPEETIYREAALKAGDDLCNQPGNSVNIIVYAYEKKNKKDVSKHVIFNTYHLLIALRRYEKASVFRQRVQTQLGIDLALEDDVHPKK